MNGKSSPDFGMSRRQFLQGAVAVGAVTTFGDAGDAAPAVRFGFITDCHYAAHIKPSRWRNHCDGLLKMDVFTAKMNELGVDFVVEGGDFKDLGRTPAESLAYLREIEGRFAAFKGPRYHVLGNHDHDNISKEEFLAEIANEGQPKAKAFYSFARNIKIPIRVEVGSADTVCPPMAGFSAFNVMPSKDKEIHIGLGQGHAVFKEFRSKLDRWMTND